MKSARGEDAETLWEDGEFLVARVVGLNGDASRLVVSTVLEHPDSLSVAKLENAFALREELAPSGLLDRSSFRKFEAGLL